MNSQPRERTEPSIARRQDTSPRRRVVVIGSDGASPELIFRWAKEGLLPAFRTLIAKGTHGGLASTIPPHSGPAWVSAITGKNPGKHGVFYFTTVNPSRVPPRIVSSRDIRTDTLFDVLDVNDKKCIIVNVPITYPPWRIGGILVSGMFAPSESVRFTYPPEIGPALVEKGYEVEFSTWDTWDTLARKRAMTDEEAQRELAKRRSNYFSRMIEMDDKNTKAFVDLIGSHEWDFSMVMLPALDRIQHLLWAPLSSEEEHQAGKDFGCSRYIVEAYQNLDRLVEKVVAAVGDDTWTIIMSDHGFGRTPRVFFANRWLKERGYLTPAAGQENRMAYVYRRSVRRARSILASLRTGRPLRGPDMPAFHGLLPLSEIEPSGTRAYAPTPYGLVNLNPRTEAERHLLTSTLPGEFESITDPLTGRQVIKRAHLTSELYPGPYQGEASDLLLEPDPDYYIENRVGGDKVLEDATRHPASHKPQGILVIAGPELRPDFEVGNLRIQDIAPMVLRLLGVPIPKDMDGIPTDEIFLPGSKLGTQKAMYSGMKGGRREVTDRIKRLKSEGKL